MPAQCATGTYVGDGALRTIVVGWQPDFVCVKSETTEFAWIRMSSMPAGRSVPAAGLGTYLNRIGSFVANGFEIGTDNGVNKLGVNFVWWALQAAANEVAVGTYTGDGTPNRHIDVGLGAAPMYVMCVHEASDFYNRFEDDPRLETGRLADDDATQGAIEHFYNSGFDADTPYLNTNLFKFYWLAIREVANFSTHGTYNGDGIDNRNIAVGGGVVPGVVVLQGWDDIVHWWKMYYAHFRTTAHPLTLCSRFSNVTDAANQIQAQAAASFEIGTSVQVNDNGHPYYWFALAVTGGGAVAKNVADTGAGMDVVSVAKGGVGGCSTTEVDHSTAAIGPTASPWSHAIVTTPEAIVLIYQEGAFGLMYIFTPDTGLTWSAPALISNKTDFYPSAVGDLCTDDIHIVYSKLGDPTLGAGNSVYYRSLIRTGAAVPTWQLSEEVEVAYGSTGAGYSNAVLSVELGSCDYPVVGGNAGKLVCMTQRKTDTDRSWSALVATAPWTLQGAKETPVAIPSSSPAERAAIGVANGRIYTVTNVGGRFAFYRSKAIAWGDAAVDFISWDGWGGDYSEGFGLAVDFWNNQTIQAGDATLAAREVAVAYIKDLKIHYREWGLPITDAETPWMTMNDLIVWPTADARCASISRVGQSYWVTGILHGWGPFNQIAWAEGPSFGTWYLIAEDAIGETWNWLAVPQYATSCYDFAAAWSQLVIGAKHVYVGRCPLHIPTLQCEAAVGADTYNLKLPIAETGTGADVLMLELRLADPGAGVDVVRILLSLEDIGVGGELAGWARMAAEAGIGLDAYAINIGHTDTGVGAEVSTIGLSMMDAGAGVDALVRQIIIQIAEAATGLEVTGLMIKVVDTGTGVETYLLSICMADTGAGTDVPVIMLNVADIGTATDIINLLFYILETGVGGDVVGVGLVTPDTATGADSIRLILNIAESGVGSEQVSMVIYVTLALLRLLMSSGKLRLDIEGPGA